MEKHSHKDIESLVRLITDADAVVVGAGSGLSSAAEHLKGRSLYLQGNLADILKELRIQLEKEK